MSADEAEATLKEKKRLLHELLESRKFGPEYSSLQDELLSLERIVSEARGEPYAVETAVMESWPGMAHFTAVIGDSFHCTVLFATLKREHIALRFVSVVGYKLTAVSDETMDGHPLTGRGLASYRAFVVNNSAWVKELESIDTVHPNHSPARWRTSRHYLLGFKDRMFEAIAENVEFLGTFSTVEQALTSAAAQVRTAVR
jgi:hypothetical protein